MTNATRIVPLRRTREIRSEAHFALHTADWPDEPAPGARSESVGAEYEVSRLDAEGVALYKWLGAAVGIVFALVIGVHFLARFAS